MGRIGLKCSGRRSKDFDMPLEPVLQEESNKPITGELTQKPLGNPPKAGEALFPPRPERK